MKEEIAKTRSVRASRSDRRSKVKMRPAYRRDALASLGRGLKSVAKQRGWRPRQAGLLWARWIAPLRILNELAASAADVLDGLPGADARFRKRCLNLASSFSGRSEKKREVARAQLKDTKSRACTLCKEDMVPLEGIAPIYVAALAVFADDATTMSQAFEGIAATSRAADRIEASHRAWNEGGVDGLNDHVGWGEAIGDSAYDPVGEPYGGPHGDPYGGSPGGGRPGGPGVDGEIPGVESGIDDLVGYQPDPNPDGDDNPERRWLDHNGRLFLYLDILPHPDIEDSDRNFCEGLLRETLEQGAPSLVNGGSISAWADDIESIESLGRCAGDKIIIHGSGFGSSQSEGRRLLLPTTAGCAVADVPDQDWSDTRIEVILPQDVTSGPVGFYSPLGVNSYNQWTGQLNAHASDILVASRCLGTPLDMPRFEGIRRIPCPPNLTINRIEAGDVIVHSFVAESDAGTGNVIVVDPGDEITLKWHVDNAETITIRRIGPNGPALHEDGSTELINPAGTMLALGPANHVSTETFKYELEAINTCGPAVVVEVLVIARKSPALQLERVQVTQAIQTDDNKAPLIAGKRTVVRAVVRHGLDGFGGLTEVPFVRGRLRVIGATESAWIYPINGSSANPPEPGHDANIKVTEEPVLSNTNDTLNFLIPPALAQGHVEFEIEAFVDDFGVPDGMLDDDVPGLDDSVTSIFGPFEFLSRRHIHVKYIPITVDDPGIHTFASGVDNPPTNIECREFLEESLQQIPTTITIEHNTEYSISINADSWVFQTPVGDFTFWWDGFDIFGNVQLEWVRIIRTCGFYDVLNLVCPDHDESVWALITSLRSPWGRAHIGGLEYITPFRVDTGAHEFGHVVGQRHLQACADEPGGEPNEDFPNGGTIAEIPFDIWNNSAMGTGARDVMTYCSTRWVSIERWQRMFNWIGE